MNNRELAAALFKIATLLKDRQDNPYRVRAYLNGARALMRRDSEDMVTPLQCVGETLPHPKGVLGDRVQRRLRDLALHGRMEYFDALCADLPSYMGALMQIPGVGPRTAERLYDTLGVETPEQLRRAARQGRLGDVWGIGPKRAAQYAQLSLFDDSEFAADAPRQMAA